MAQAVGRNAAAPLLFLNFIMYIIVIGFASWNLNHFINGQTHHPGITVFLYNFRELFNLCRSITGVLIATVLCMLLNQVWRATAQPSTS